MASDNINDNTNCPVCYEEFDLNQHIPRIFPCFDTICESCIIKFLRQRQHQLTCPQCRAVHQTWNKGVKAFKQNKYIAANLQKMESNSKRKATPEKMEYALCKTHNMELTLFCRRASCMKAICSKCLTKDHILHDIIDTEDQHKMYLATGRKAIENITEMYNELWVAKTHMNEGFDRVQAEMDSTKHEIIQYICAEFNKYKITSDGQKMKNAEAMQENLDFLNEKLQTLYDIIEELNKQYAETYDVELYENIQQNIQQKLDATSQMTSTIQYQYSAYKTAECRRRIASEICGKLIVASDEGRF